MKKFKKIYHIAKLKAIANGLPFHVAAILKRNGKVISIRENTEKTHPRFKRQYADGSWASHMHAEMNVLRFAKPGDEIEVIRFKKCDYGWTMAKPCKICESEIKKSGIKKIRYTNWDGAWEELRV